MKTNVPNISTRRAIWSIDEHVLAALDAETQVRLIAEQAMAASAGPAAAAAAAAQQESRGGDVAIIRLSGVITPWGSMLMSLLGFGGGGLEGFRYALRRALADGDVGGIVLEIDSPGGLVDLVPETAAEIREARGTKPIVAIANTMACSAAYYLASQADEVAVTPSGMMGSIGVVIRHADLSGRYEQMGVKTTLIYAGKHKVDGNPYEPLSDQAREGYQAEVDTIQEGFLAAVATGRGVDVATVRENFGEGAIFLAEDAVAAGLADKVATLDDVVAELGGQLEEEDGAGMSASHGVAFGVADHEAAELHAIPFRKTATDDEAKFEGGEFEKLITGSAAEIERKMREYSAWEDAAVDSPKPKNAFKFGHHLVGADGNVGAASVGACRNVIQVLNGARGGTKIPSSDRQGVYDHAAKHLRDAGVDPAPLKSQSKSARRRQRRREAAAGGQSMPSAEGSRRALDVLLG